jgi:purine-binding chemotaxis protein CheW
MDSAIMAGIDWERLQLRLEKSRRALEHGFAPDSEKKRRILRGRAEALAREPASTLTPAISLDVVEFLVAQEHYGVELSHIREVYPLKDLLPLPATPSFVLGLINVRGEILSVIDIKKFFDLPEKGLSDLNKVLIVRAGQMEVGILADTILSVRSIAVDEIQPALPTLTGIRADYIKGVTKDAVVILDVEEMLSDKRILVDEE